MDRSKDRCSLVSLLGQDSEHRNKIQQAESECTNRIHQAMQNNKLVANSQPERQTDTDSEETDNTDHCFAKCVFVCFKKGH